MSNVQAAKLIIENIQLLEQAKIILEGEITEKLLAAVDKVVQEYIDSLDVQWDGYFKLSEDYLT